MLNFGNNKFLYLNQKQLYVCVVESQNEMSQ
jgi:hypothetical protein